MLSCSRRQQQWPERHSTQGYSQTYCQIPKVSGQHRFDPYRRRSVTPATGRFTGMPFAVSTNGGGDSSTGVAQLASLSASQRIEDESAHKSNMPGRRRMHSLLSSVGQRRDRDATVARIRSPADPQLPLQSCNCARQTGQGAVGVTGKLTHSKRSPLSLREGEEDPELEVTDPRITLHLRVERRRKPLKKRRHCRPCFKFIGVECISGLVIDHERQSNISLVWES